MTRYFCIGMVQHEMVPPVRLELTRLAALDFESSASTNSTTGAYDVYVDLMPTEQVLLFFSKIGRSL